MPGPEAQSAVISDSRRETAFPAGRPSIEQFPMYKIRDDFKRALLESNRVLLIGPPGSGKTTLAPLFMLEVASQKNPNARIIVTQPKKIAVDNVAQRVEQTIGKGIVGYRYKRANTITDKTQIAFMVDGSLVNELKRNPTLYDEEFGKWDAVFIDEVHKNTKKMLQELAGLKKAQVLREKQGKPPLRIVVATGTGDIEELQEYLPGLIVCEAEGRLNLITNNYLDHEVAAENIVDEAVNVFDRVLEVSPTGDKIVFMPGRSHITETIDKLKAKYRERTDISFYSVTGGDLDKGQNVRLDEKAAPGQIRVFVGTDVMQESITIPGVKDSIVSGRKKEIAYDARRGLSSLVTVEATQADMKQQGGRAGRDSAGNAWFLMTKSQFDRRPAFPKSEIQGTDLTELVLGIKEQGEDPYTFDFMKKPPKEHLDAAIEVLQKLGALDVAGNITEEIGRKMAELPVDPHYARMLVEAKKRKTTNAVSVVVGFLSSQRSVFDFNPRTSRFDQKYAQFLSRDSDYITLLRVWNGYVQNRDRAVGWCKSNGLNYSVLKEVEQTKNDFIDEEDAQALGIEERDVVFDVANNELLVEIQKCVTAGFVDRLLKYTGRGEYAMEYGPIRGIKIGNRSALLGENHQYVVADTIVVRGRRDRPVLTIAETCQMVKNEWIREVAPQLFPKTSEAPKEEQIQKQRAENSYGRDAAVHHPTETERIQREQQISRSETEAAKPTLWGRVKRFFGSFFGS